MAAPMSSDSQSEDDESFRGIPDYLDWRTPQFDPLRAIYDERTPIPKVSGVKQFNNIAQLENFMKGQDAHTLKKKKEANKSQSEDKMPGIIAERAAAQAKEAVRKAAIMAKNDGPSERSQTQSRRIRSTTVFTRMEGYKQGPLSLMRRCVEERLRVIIVVRAAVAVRSRCRGYIVAFDKHFNMAIMDVDEKLIRPVSRKKSVKFKTKAETEFLSEPTQRLSLESSSTSREGYRLDQDSDKKSRNSSENHSDSSKQTDLREQLLSKRLERNKLQDKSKEIDKKCSKDYQDHFRNCLSDSNIYTDRQKKKMFDKKTCESDSEIKVKSDVRTLKTTDKLKQQYQPFWPLYKRWTEMRCNSEYEIISRHVNQLFIRGDNVVSVSLCN